jgi:hypothetical protein
MNGARLIAAGSAALLAGVGAAALPASASEPPPPNGAQQFTTGGFEDRSCQFGFEAHTGPNGEVTGHLNQKCGEGSPRPFYARGPVLCLDVEGNRAGFVWQVQETSDQSFQGLYEHFSVMDNGPPGQGVPDMVVSAPNTATPPPSCAPLAETVPVLKGNIVVHDTTP